MLHLLPPPKVHNHLLSLADVKSEVIILTPCCQGINLPSVCWLVPLSDEAHNGCVISKLNDEIGTVRCRTSCVNIMCEQGEQEGAEHTALGGACVGDHCGWGTVTDSHHLWPPRQEVEDPLAQGDVKSQVHELGEESGGDDGAECWTVVNKQHPHIRIPFVQVGECGVYGGEDGIVWRPVGPVCKLHRVQGGGQWGAN